MANWFKSPFYFMLCAMFGFFTWSFCFDSQLNLPSQQTELSSYAPKFEDYNLNNDDRDLYNYDLAHAVDISDEDLLQQLEISEEDWVKEATEPYELSPAEVEDYNNLIIENSGNKISTGELIQISATKAMISYQETKSCSDRQMIIENAIGKNPLVSELIKERSAESTEVPRKCITHVMNNFSDNPKIYAKCPQGTKGKPVRGGTKPCVTKTIVNVTYNSFIDVASCLGINPKSLLPKLANESGMMINTLGGGNDAGVGQLTVSAIEQVNMSYKKYLKEVSDKAATNAACGRLNKHMNLLKMAPPELANRCSLIAPPENPLRNIFYMGALNRYNIDYMKNKMEETKAMDRLKQLGLKDAKQSQLVESLALAGYNAGPGTIYRIFDGYLTKRLAAKKNLTEADFDFHSPKKAKDIDGVEKTVTEIARNFASSPYIKKNDPKAAIKIKRAKLLPEKIKNSYLLSFPEYLIFNQNNYHSIARDPKRPLRGYKTIGAPGYLTFLAEKDKSLRQTFMDTGVDQYYCSNPKFLKIK